MRTNFIKALSNLAAEDERIWLLCGDLGYSVLEDFAGKFPERFVNAGVAEQNMAGMAAGLALSGKIVFTYSIANFPVMRCLEQIRNDICYHNLNVKVVAVGGGLAYGSAGYSHHAVEDIAVMRVLPNMTVIAPGDPVEAQLATAAIAKLEGPAYLRLGKAGEPMVHQTPPSFQIGKAIQMKEGNDLTLISTGGMLRSVMEVAEKLLTRKHSVEVLSMHTLQPIDRDAILKSARSKKIIITVEEHGIGGLGTAVAETLAEANIPPVRFIPLRLSREVITVAGSQEELRAKSGLSVENILETAMSALSQI